MVVKVASWGDNMDIVSKGKNQLREIGIAVASDFVERQRDVMKVKGKNC